MNLEIFSDDELHQKVITDYWLVNNEYKFVYKLSDISDKYGLSTHEISKLVDKLSKSYSTNSKCSECGQPHRYKNRSNFNSHREGKKFTCDTCKELSVLDKKNKKLEALNKHLRKRLENPVSVNILKLKDAIYLLALLKHSGSEDLSHISEYQSVSVQRLTPRNAFDLEIADYLYESKLLAINPDSDLRTFSLTENSEIVFDPQNIQWVIPLDNSYNHPSQFIEELESKLSSMEFWPYDELQPLMLRISLEEVLSYLEFALAKHTLYFTPGDKTRIVLSKALDNFSVSQIHNFIWRAAKDAAAFYVRKNIHKKHAANSVVGNIERQCELAINEKWDVKSYKRNYHMPQTVISRVLFNTLLKTNDGGFTLPLSTFFNE